MSATSSSGRRRARPPRGSPAAPCCKALLRALGVEIYSHVIQIGSVRAPAAEQALTPEDFAAVDESPVRCLDADASRAMVREIDELRKANESLGGVFEVQAFGLLPGLGSHVSWEQRLDGRLAMAICSIQAIKGFSIGDAFTLAGLPGSQAHDEIFYSAARGYYRETNRAGGLEGGMTDGQPLLVRAAMKPLPTLTKPLRSVDTETHEPAQALRERTDSCTVPAAGVVGEAMVASCSPAPTARSSAETTSTTCSRPSTPTSNGSDGTRPDRVHGRRQVERRPRTRRLEGREPPR